MPLRQGFSETAAAGKRSGALRFGEELSDCAAMGVGFAQVGEALALDRDPAQRPGSVVAAAQKEEFDVLRGGGAGDVVTQPDSNGDAATGLRRRENREHRGKNREPHQGGEHAGPPRRLIVRSVGNQPAFLVEREAESQLLAHPDEAAAEDADHSGLDEESRLPIPADREMPEHRIEEQEEKSLVDEVPEGTPTPDALPEAELVAPHHDLPRIDHGLPPPKKNE